jgi:maltooligosyltrehalose trehalohydrolase
MSQKPGVLFMMGRETSRRYPIGAEALPNGGAHFRVWAPRRRSVAVVFEGGPGHDAGDLEMEQEPSGYFSGTAAEAAHGSLYRFRLDGGETLFPDPASRFQPEGPHGPSQVVDPKKFQWTDGRWRGAGLRGQVIYEIHVGTFTEAGTWKAATRELAELASLGITVVELMPVADFPGRFGWGYDGVNLFAPTRLYGEPDDLRRFVDRAHALGIGVILDVVYNHLGPDGNFLGEFAESYFTDSYETDWGEAINFDGHDAQPVREFFLTNAAYWVEEFHIDGLRLDATDQIFDHSPRHILADVCRTVRHAARGKSTLLVAENEQQQVNLVRPETQGGYGLDALWNDDFHHSAMVALTGRNEAYYTDYRGRPQEFISAVKWGYLYQGQRYKWQKKRRGTPSIGIEPAAFVLFIQNHDQIANSGRGLRCHALTSPGLHRAMTALMLLAPGTPMLFQGQEFAASSPFLYFADHEADLVRAIRKGRARFLSQFPSLATVGSQAVLADPGSEKTFIASKLDVSERKSHEEVYALHRDLLNLRREDAAFNAQRWGGVDGAVLGDGAFVLRFFDDGVRDRLLVINLTADLHLDPAPEPLLAPPEGMRWRILWSSEDPRYGGGGVPEADTEQNWCIPGRAAIVLAPQPAAGDP